MINNRIFLSECIALLCVFFSSATFAVSDEVQVYTDDMNAAGEFGVELHLNYVIDGERQAGYAGAAPSQHMLQATPEFSYGITKNWEAGIYVPVARE